MELEKLLSVFRLVMLEQDVVFAYAVGELQGDGTIRHRAELACANANMPIGLAHVVASSLVPDGAVVNNEQDHKVSVSVLIQPSFGLSIRTPRGWRTRRF